MPARLVIEGGVPLRGLVEASAAKNAALPAMAASLLTAQSIVLDNVPRLADVVTMTSLLERLGAKISREADGATRLSVPSVTTPEAPYELVSTMRASVVVLGPLLARTGTARVALPGGCAIGVRPIDQHLKGLAKLGADIAIQNGYVEARASRLKGARITTDLVTVTGTENLMMAAALAEGVTVLENAAREPEVADLARLLTAMGARIEGAGTERIEIEGVPELGGARHRVIPDRIEAGTLLVAGAITGGDVTLTGVTPRHLQATLAKLEECGVSITVEGDRVRCLGPARPRPADVITSPFPGFPTDMQAQMMALLGRDPGRRGLSGRSRHGHRPPRVRIPGPGRAGRAGHHGGLACLPPGSRLRGARAKAPVARSADRAGEDLAMPALTVALPKGRLLDPALQLLSAMGIQGLEADTRKLLLADAERDLRFIFLKPADIPTYVQYGAADLGIVGKDILAEQQPDVYEPVDLGFGFCRLVVAEPRELWERDDPAKWSWVRVATKYPTLTERYFSERGIQVEMIRLDGSIELAPLVGLAERIVDLVQSGETLRANGLVEVAEIMTSTARLIVNRASLKTAHARVNALIAAMRQEVAK